jgi:hypothetical protein
VFIDAVFVRKTHLFGNEQPVPADAPNIRSLSTSAPCSSNLDREFPFPSTELASRHKPKVAGGHP